VDIGQHTNVSLEEHPSVAPHWVELRNLLNEGYRVQRTSDDGLCGAWAVWHGVKNLCQVHGWTELPGFRYFVRWLQSVECRRYVIEEAMAVLKFHSEAYWHQNWFTTFQLDIGARWLGEQCAGPSTRIRLIYVNQQTVMPLSQAHTITEGQMISFDHEIHVFVHWQPIAPRNEKGGDTTGHFSAIVPRMLDASAVDGLSSWVGRQHPELGLSREQLEANRALAKAELKEKKKLMEESEAKSKKKSQAKSKTKPPAKLEAKLKETEDGTEDEKKKRKPYNLQKAFLPTILTWSMGYLLRNPLTGVEGPITNPMQNIGIADFCGVEDENLVSQHSKDLRNALIAELEMELQDKPNKNRKGSKAQFKKGDQVLVRALCDKKAVPKTQEELVEDAFNGKLGSRIYALKEHQKAVRESTRESEVEPSPNAAGPAQALPSTRAAASAQAAASSRSAASSQVAPAIGAPLRQIVSSSNTDTLPAIGPNLPDLDGAGNPGQNTLIQRLRQEKQEALEEQARFVETQQMQQLKRQPQSPQQTELPRLPQHAQHAYGLPGSSITWTRSQPGVDDEGEMQGGNAVISIISQPGLPTDDDDKDDEDRDHRLSKRRRRS